MHGRQTALRLAVIAVTSIAAAVSAHAYSRQAVDDARALAKVTINKVMMGVASKTDAALAAYNVSAMAYKANLISAAAYCRAVQPSLQIVASEFDADSYRHPGIAAPYTGEQQAALKKAWQDAVAGMKESPSKCREASAMTERLVFGAIDDGDLQSAVKTAKAELDMVENKAAGGTATGVEVGQAKLDLLDAQYRAKLVSRNDYCDSGLKVATDTNNIIHNAEDSGQQVEWLTLVQVIAAKRYLFQLRAVCQTN
jgi:hypothetical protein